MRRGYSTRVAVAAAAWLVLEGDAVRAAPAISAELVAGGGHDSNLLHAVDPDAPAGTVPVSSVYAAAAPALNAAVFLSSWRLETSYVADYRRVKDAGHLYFQEAAFEVSPPAIGPVRARAAGSLGTFGATGATGADDLGFRFAAATLAARVEIAEALRLHTSVRHEARAQRSGGERWWTGDVRMPVRPRSTWQVGPFASLVRIAGTAADDAVIYRRWRTGLEAAAVWGRTTVQAAGFLGRVSAQAPARFELGAALDVRLRLLDEVDLLGIVQATRVTRDTDPDADLSRRVVFVGVSVHATTKPTVTTPKAPGETAVEIRPAIVQGRVRFRHRAGDARTVVVMGSWNGWAAPGARLVRVRDTDIWEIWVPLGPGAHRYRFVADGQAVRPQSAPRYVPDDFGGEDAVVDVVAPDERSP